jgi:endonuclease-3
MDKKAMKIFSLLEKEYPKARTALKFKNPWQMLVSTILSAQCTDERVNKITETLFKEHPDVDDYIDMDTEHIIAHIRSSGFYKNKAKSILGSAREIKERFNGKVPKNMEDMLSLPGVARKTANVVLGNAYNVVEGIALFPPGINETDQPG